MSAGTSGCWADRALLLPGAARFLESGSARRQFARQTLKCSTQWSSTASCSSPAAPGPQQGFLLASLTAQCAAVTRRDRDVRERLGAPLHLPQRPLTCGHFSGAYGSQTAERGGEIACHVCQLGGEKGPPRSYFLHEFCALGRKKKLAAGEKGNGCGTHWRGVRAVHARGRSERRAALLCICMQHMTQLFKNSCPRVPAPPREVWSTSLGEDARRLGSL